MNILIINTLRIPSGEASVNRLLSYSKGLVEIGNEVSVVSTAAGPTGWQTVDGIRYHMLRKCGESLGLPKSLIRLLHYLSTNKGYIDSVIIITSSPLLIIPVQLMCKAYHLPIIQEKSEYPFVFMRKGAINKILSFIYNNLVFRLFDGMIIMTAPLMNFYRRYTCKSCRLIKVPMTVDMSRFDNVEATNQYGDYAAYCGNMSGNKDGVMNLIEAFSYVEPKHPDFKLLMIGSTNESAEFEKIKNRVSELGLKNVIFTGRVTRDEIPALLTNAKVLCLARPSSLQSTGGFPTKLGEYLMTGHPVVVTAVGEIPDYLNETNSFIVEPDNNETFGNRINEVLDDYQRASNIGLEGRKVAMENFNYKVQSERIHQFLLETLIHE